MHTTILRGRGVGPCISWQQCTVEDTGTHTCMNGILHCLLYQSQDGIIVNTVFTQREINELSKRD